MAARETNFNMTLRMSPVPSKISMMLSSTIMTIKKLKKPMKKGG